MEWSKEYSPAYTLLRVVLEPGESITAEPGAMMLIRGDVDIKTSTGGLGAALKRRLLGGEALFLNTYTARSSAELWLVPGAPGDVEALELTGDEWVVQDTSYLAHYGDVEVSARFRGFRGLIAEGELFWLSVRGRGTVWVSSYGGLKKLEVRAGERIVVDNFHLVAMPANTEYRVRKFGGWKSFLLGGEGFILEVYGPTILYLQTRILPPLAQLLAKYLPGRSS